jgi:uncharacterized membrane-anchored protein YhcB (DUF1043 family)
MRVQQVHGGELMDWIMAMLGFLVGVEIGKLIGKAMVIWLK